MVLYSSNWYVYDFIIVLYSRMTPVSEDGIILNLVHVTLLFLGVIHVVLILSSMSLAKLCLSRTTFTFLLLGVMLILLCTSQMLSFTVRS
jgi:hypothetical protein